MRTCQTEPDDLQFVFLGHRWIEHCVLEYRKGNRKLSPLRGRSIIFPERHFAAALMHLYIGAFSLSEIAKIVSTTRAELISLRTDIDFMTLVDMLKASFARSFRENVVLNEYQPVGYASIAAEYAALEEQARNQIRVPLFKHMKQLANVISDKASHHLSIDLHDLKSFKRLFSFFVFEEYFLPELAKPSLPQLKRIAKDIVWNRLGEHYDDLGSVLYSELLRNGVKDELKRRFECLNIR